MTVRVLGVQWRHCSNAEQVSKSKSRRILVKVITHIIITISSQTLVSSLRSQFCKSINTKLLTKIDYMLLDFHMIPKTHAVKLL